MLFCHNEFGLIDVKKRVIHIFALVINFLGVDWQPKFIIIGLFLASETIGQVLGKNSTALLDEYGLKTKIVVYVQDEGGKLECNDSGT
jgi:hypothetical protein